MIDEMNKNEKAFDFWRNELKSCRHVLAPMVDQSELAFRMLVRQYYGVHCCYTPMIGANSFIHNLKLRKQCLETDPEDRPLILQFCASNSQSLVDAAKLAEDHCDAIDLNLGCPQSVAKRGHYGAFLMDEWDLIYDMVNRVSKEIKVPITCKIRVFPEIEKTVEYAKMLERAGASLICVHGRRREQKGADTGLASWQHIKAVKDALTIPVFANGNILTLDDVERCLSETGVEAVISAEGSLHNPAIFTGRRVPVWVVAEQYLALAKKHPCPLSYIRGHIFKFFHHCFMLPSNLDLRERVAKTHSIDVFDEVTRELKNRYQNEYITEKERTDDWRDCSAVPPYICQSFLRPKPKVGQTNKRSSEENESSEETVLKMSKKKRKNRSTEPKPRPVSKRILCTLCPNPKGEKCEFGICRACCRKKTFLETLDCAGHKFQMKSRLAKKCHKSESNDKTI